MKILKPFYLLLLAISIISCDSNETETTEEPVDSEINEEIEDTEIEEEIEVTEIDEEIEDQEVNTNISSISFPQGTGSYFMDKNTYEYNESNQIEKISFGGTVYGVEHIGDEKIELTLLYDNVTNLDTEIVKTIHLEDNVVQYIVTNTKFVATNGYTQQKRDSISFKYSDNYPSRIEYYSKHLIHSPNSYDLVKEVDLTMINGNIVKKVTSQDNLIKTSNYEYDNETHIEHGENIYETPMFIGFEYILIHDKLGERNTNNIIALTNDFDTSDEFVSQYKTINYSRVMDSNNRLVEISISGTTIATDPSYPSSASFSGKKGLYAY